MLGLVVIEARKEVEELLLARTQPPLIVRRMGQEQAVVTYRQPIFHIEGFVDKVCESLGVAFCRQVYVEVVSFVLIPEIGPNFFKIFVNFSSPFRPGRIGSISSKKSSADLMPLLGYCWVNFSIDSRVSSSPCWCPSAAKLSAVWIIISINLSFLASVLRTQHSA